MKNTSSSKFWRVVTTITTLAFVLQISGFTTLPALAVAPNYLMGPVTAEVTGALELSIFGSASATPYVGQESAQYVSIDWGDTVRDSFTIQTDSNFTTVFSAGNFTTSWTPISHAYASEGMKTIIVKVHHQSWNGNGEGNASEFTTNVFIPPAALNVIKIVDGGDKLPSEFTINVSGTNVSPASFPGDSGGTIVSLEPGSYSVTEDSVDNYTGLFSDDCSGTIASGETKICTITNVFSEEPMADIIVVKNDDVETNAQEGDTITYTIQISNNGPDDATGVVVDDLLPVGVAFVSAVTTQGTYNEITGVWTVGELADQASATLDIEVTVNEGTAGTSITNTASSDRSQAEQADSTPENNSSTEETPISCTDSDGDGYYEEGGQCGPIDCQPGDYSSYPGAPEVCDGVDNDCNGQSEDGSGETWYGELTSCGTGVCESSGVLTCVEGEQVDTCEVGTPTENPETSCDAYDNDCDGETNEGGICEQALICGYKFNDLNQNQEKDTGEPTLLGWLISLAQWANDDWTPITTDTTNDEGQYCFDSLAEGTYMVEETPQDNWYNSTPLSVEVLVSTNQLYGVDFGNFQCVDNDGDTYSSTNQEVCSPLDCDETDNTVYPSAPELCDDKDNDCDQQIDEDGACFLCQPEDVQECDTGLEGVCATGTQTCDVEGQWGSCQQDVQASEEVCDNDLDDDCDGLTDIQDPNCQPPVDEGSICGYKFYDDNQDSLFNNSDYGLYNWTMWAEGARIITTPTNLDGYYCFTGLTAGTWYIYEQLVADWTTTTDATTTVELTENAGITGINFGNIMCIDDDGDGFAENGGLICGPTDCNDQVEGGEEINPGATEICTDQIDNNCDGLTDSQDTLACPPPAPTCTDNDGDGYYAEGGDCGEADCNDNSYSLDNVCITPPPGGGGGGGGLPQSLYIHTEALTAGSETVSVVITWFTNKLANSRVVYDTVSHPTPGTPPNYGYQWSTSTFDDDPKVTFHSIEISGLLAGTTYYFRPISAASPEVYGVELSFTTGQWSLTPPEEITPPAPPTPPVETPGIVAGVEFEEEGTVLGEETGDLTGEEVQEPAPAEENVIAPPPAAEGPVETSCNTYIWILLILDIILSAALWFRNKNAVSQFAKNSWILIILLSIVPVIIWYPACWLATWLIIVLIAAVILIVVSKNKTQTPSLGQSQQ